MGIYGQNETQYIMYIYYETQYIMYIYYEIIETILFEPTNLMNNVSDVLLSNGVFYKLID